MPQRQLPPEIQVISFAQHASDYSDAMSDIEKKDSVKVIRIGQPRNMCVHLCQPRHQVKTIATDFLCLRAATMEPVVKPEEVG